MELPGSNYGHRYVLHTVKKRDEAAAGYPKTLPPYSDNDFENADWPNGYRDIDPFESYRQVFNGALSMFEILNLFLVVDKIRVTAILQIWYYINCLPVPMAGIHMV